MGAQMQRGAYSRVCGASTAKRPAAMGYAGAGPAQRATGSRLGWAACRQDPLYNDWTLDAHRRRHRFARVLRADGRRGHAALSRAANRRRRRSRGRQRPRRCGRGQLQGARIRHPLGHADLHGLAALGSRPAPGQAARRVSERDMKKYAEVSQRVMAIIRSLAPVVEEAGIDEAYADLSFAGSYEKAEAVCRDIKQAIRDRERLSASVGIGPNKLIAKIASNEKKPDGLTVVREHQAEAFLEPLPVRKIPGIGPKTEAELAKQGVRLVRDLKRFSREELQERFGKRGAEFYEMIRGQD